MMVDGWLRPAFRIIAYGTYLFVVCPIAVILIASLTAADFISFPPRGLSFRWYSELAQNREFLESALISLVLATLTSLTSTIIAVPAAIALVRYRFPGREFLDAFFLSPLMLPSVVIGIALLQFASLLGLVGNPVVLWLAHVLVATPYCLRLLIASLTRFDRNLERAAINLGASRLQAFLRVVLPLIAPGAAAGAAFAFVVSFDDLVVSMFLTSPSLMPLPVRIYNYIDQASSPLVTAVGSLLVLFAAGIVFLIDRTIGVEGAFRMSQKR